jgi:adenine C2-methylase RlmN of 23S rRNA A2503 and tRNA A37
MTVEAGYYIHYFNNEIIDKTIELSTSYGCVFKCKYCASSKIDKFKIVSVDDNLKIIEKICEINHIDNNENLIIALTGTGDYRCTYKYANNLIVKAKQCYPNSKFIISSCAWNSSLIQQAQDINKDYFLFLQLTYISYDREKVEKIIPCYPCDFSIDGLAKLIGESSLGEKFRINYLMINNINDTEADFDKFIAIISPIKGKILVRISKLNETSCSKNNGLYATHDNNLELLKSKCKQNGIEAYIFKAYQNDNMNCGQLVTDEDK